MPGVEHKELRSRPALRPPSQSWKLQIILSIHTYCCSLWVRIHFQNRWITVWESQNILVCFLFKLSKECSERMTLVNNSKWNFFHPIDHSLSGLCLGADRLLHNRKLRREQTSEFRFRKPNFCNSLCTALVIFIALANRVPWPVYSSYFTWRNQVTG